MSGSGLQFQLFLVTNEGFLWDAVDVSDDPLDESEESTINLAKNA